MPLIRSQKMIADEASLLVRRPSVEPPASTAPAPTPKVDPFQVEAERAEELLDAQGRLAATQFASEDLKARAAAAAEELIRQGVSPEEARATAAELIAVLVRGGVR